MITFIVYSIVMLLNCVAMYHIGKARGMLEALDDRLRDIENTEKQ